MDESRYYCLLHYNGEKHITKLSDTNGKKYNLEKHDFFRYLQLRQYFLKEIRKNEATTEPNDIIQLMVQVYTGSSISVVSELYQGITRGRGATTTYIRERWEKELNDKISSQQWENV